MNKKLMRCYLLVIAVLVLLEPVCFIAFRIVPYMHFLNAYEVLELITESRFIIRLLLVICLYILMRLFEDGRLSPASSENPQAIEELRERLVQDKEKDSNTKDVLELMLNNMSEIQAYYAISKQHAWLSFALAVVFCILGFVLFSQALAADIESQQPIIIGAIGGTISEIFAGTALLVHKGSLKQLNRYYLALHENERFLSTVNLVDRLSVEKREEAIMKIIDNSLTNITSLVNEFSGGK